MSSCGNVFEIFYQIVFANPFDPFQQVRLLLDPIGTIVFGFLTAIETAVRNCFV